MFPFVQIQVMCCLHRTDSSLGAARPEQTIKPFHWGEQVNNVIYLLRKATILKEIVHSKMKVCWKCTHPRPSKMSRSLYFSSEQICINVALHHLLTNGSSAVNGCRQNLKWVSKQLIKHHNIRAVLNCFLCERCLIWAYFRCRFLQTADKNISIIHK